MIVGNNSSARVWLNGELAYTATERKTFDPRVGEASAKLKSGRNDILVRRDKTGLFQLDLEDDEGWPADVEWLE